MYSPATIAMSLSFASSESWPISRTTVARRLTAFYTLSVGPRATPYTSHTNEVRPPRRRLRRCRINSSRPVAIGVAPRRELDAIPRHLPRRQDHRLYLQRRPL